MLDRIGHRGPDGWGCQDAGQGTIGHRRLAILDVAGGSQPMHAGEDWIAFNGEIYNHLQLKQRYLSRHRFHTRTDTEVVLKLFRKLGERSVELLDGMFSIAIFSEGELFLARDPLGIKPLYTAEKDGKLYFASEIKALVGVADQIREFPPGHWYHSRLGWHRFYNVADIPSRAETLPDEDSAIRSIRRVLGEAVEKRLMSDVPLGVSLSGGLDSSIVTLLARERVANLNTFAVGVEGSEDLEAARYAAREIGTAHHEYVYTLNEILSVLPEVIYSLESFDPALVRSAIPNYFLARLASESVKVFLTGEGADELYAGYEYLNRFDRPETLQAELVYITAALHNTNLQRADRLSMAFGLEARVPFLDLQSVLLGFELPPANKLHQGAHPEKALLRRSFAGDLPDKILHRKKQKFSHGAGSADFIAQEAERAIHAADFEAERMRLRREFGYHLQTKEALYYYRILRRFYKDEWILFLSHRWLASNGNRESTRIPPA
jgi:asparagine synthase (glutamine-hydrolysing)